MNPCAAVDFETYYDKEVSIVPLGLWHYLRHPAYEAYLVSIVTSDGFEWCGHPKDAPWGRITGHDWISHNRSFDQAVYRKLQEDGILPDIQRWKNWHCTADMSAYLGVPRSLKGASEVLLGVKLSKDVRDKMKGQRWASMAPEFKQEVMEYALDDSRRCLQLWTKHGDEWPQWERDLSHLTQKMTERGMLVDRGRIERDISDLRRLAFAAAAKIPWAGTNAMLSMKALIAECRKNGIPPPPSLSLQDSGCEAWEDKYGSVFPWVHSMRTLRRSNTFLKKLESMYRRIRDDDRISLPLKYCGASTRRWSGDGGINFQNLPKEDMLAQELASFGIREDGSGINIRECLIAPEGTLLSACDLAQIEPRVLAWLIGDTAMLDALRNGLELYEAHARATLGFSDPRPLKLVDPDLRKLSKARILGLGYGCGPAKFVIVAKNLADLHVSEEEAKRIVAEYRAQNPKITGLWRKFDSLIQRTAALPAGENDLIVELPSGNKLVYRDVRRDRNDGNYKASLSKNGRMLRCTIYGGLLTENITQSVARDVFAYCLLELDRRGSDMVMQTHDEVVAEIPENLPNEMEAVMSNPPPWMSALPLAAEASTGKFYSK